jgi:hypothetical protein
MDESAPAPRHRSELAVLVDWLRVSGRTAEVDYQRLLHDVVAIARRTALLTDGQVDVDTLTSAARSVQTQLRAAIIDYDPAALALLLEGLIPLARFVGDNPLRLLVASGVLATRTSTTGPPRQRVRTRLHPPETSCSATLHTFFPAHTHPLR